MRNLFCSQKHGIILNSEIATNGETSDSLNDVGYQGPTKMSKEELTALKSAGEGTLGKSSSLFGQHRFTFVHYENQTIVTDC